MMDTGEKKMTQVPDEWLDDELDPDLDDESEE